MKTVTLPTREIFSQISNLHGTPYEVGLQIGAHVLQSPLALQAMQADPAHTNPQQASYFAQQFRQTFPDLYEEMQGTADVLKIQPEQLSYIAYSYLQTGYCSQFLIRGTNTRSGQPLLARSYELTDKLDDMNVCCVHSTKHYSHAGSVMLWFGRYDGLNDQGLAISMSAGGMPIGEGMTPPAQDGFHFWTVIRAVLDQCANVDEAIQLIKQIPHCGNPIYLLLDAAGAAARVEVYGKNIAVKPMDDQSWLAATNHYQDLQLEAGIIPVFKQSYTRLASIEHLLQEPKQYSENELMAFLDKMFPDGLCANYYNGGFGTLRSMIFNPQEKHIRVRFGTPGRNPWKTVTLDPAQPDETFMTSVIDETAPKAFWERV